ncbi:prolyl oligopeptidase family serine peptidase [Kocuria sp. M1R5S2]|uniref:prolyl oligopeptidase family serine peptidase n=1 Tax=Kocuria rhizosphaerae TaxID=3376285 RepID=UPI00379FA8EA
MYFPDVTFDFIVTIDPAGTPYEAYITAQDLGPLDLTSRYERTASREINALRAAGLREDGSVAAGAAVLVVMSADRALPDLVRISSYLPENWYLYCLSRSLVRTHRPRCLFQATPSDISDRDFRLKVGGHLQRLVSQQPIGSPFNPDTPPFPRARADCHDLPDIVRQGTARGVATVRSLGFRMDAMYTLRPDTRKLVIVNQSALSRKNQPLPIFQRWKWAPDIEATTLVLNDPTLYVSERIECGWWVGTQELDYVPLFSRAVGRLAAELDVPLEDVVFYGGSAGAFASLAMAAELPGSRAVVDIPQTDLRTYHIKSAINVLAQECFGVPDRSQIPEEYAYRLSVLERFRRLGRCPEFVYYQNTHDVTHVVDQYLEFAEQLQESFPHHRGEYRTYELNHPVKGGHTPLPRRTTVHVINDALERTA